MSRIRKDPPCAASSDCCNGLVCQAQKCTAAASCGTANAACGATSDCCMGLACQSGTCQAAASCGASGSTCSQSSPCCSGLTCTSGVCASAMSCFSGYTFQVTSFYGSDPTVWARCDNGMGPKICQGGAWVDFNDGRCYCTPPCGNPGGVCTTDGSGLCATLDSSEPPVCVYSAWNLCTQ